MLYCAKIIEETDLKRRRMKSEDRKMKEIEMTKMVEEMDLRNLTPEVDMTDLHCHTGYQPSCTAADRLL